LTFDDKNHQLAALVGSVGVCTIEHSMDSCYASCTHLVLAGGFMLLVGPTTYGARHRLRVTIRTAQSSMILQGISSAMDRSRLVSPLHRARSD
jgi:hypothetical protein